jgi:putative ABC transport system substrate-binding protein
MKRREFLLGAGAVIVAPALAQSKVYRVGFILASSRRVPVTARALQFLINGLRERGYVEGKNLLLEWREAEGNVDRMPAFAVDLVARKVDLIITGPDAAAVAAKNATQTIPIVFVGVSDPVGLGLVKSLARPEMNASGLASFDEVLTGKQLELLREVFPKVSRVAVINNPRDPINPPQIAAVKAAGAAFKISTRFHDISEAHRIDAVLRTIAQERAEALQVFTNAITFTYQKRIIDFAASERLPAVYGNVAYVESGGLMAYSFSYNDLYRRAAGYVDRILKGAQPGDLAVEQPTRLELAVNARTARALGVTVPPSVLGRADRVIE